MLYWSSDLIIIKHRKAHYWLKWTSLNSTLLSFWKLNNEELSFTKGFKNCLEAEESSTPMEKNEEEEDQEIESFSSDDEEDKGGAEKCIKHYSSSQRILLVGEGDFSFSLSLAKAFGSGHNMVATSLDTQGITIKFC